MKSYITIARSSIKYLLGLILIFTVTNGNSAISDNELWGKYKKRFVLAEGRVIDTGNNNVSHSEGQSYAMLLAVHNDDEKTFRKLWDWTTRNLAVRDDGLFAWQYVPDQAEPVEDKSNSSDGDLIIAWAMLRAGKRWKNDEYLEISRGLLRSIRQNLIHQHENYTLLLPGPQWPIRKGAIVLNPSYWVYPALREIADFDPQPVWEKLIHSGIRMMQQIRFGPWELPSDWVAVKPDGSFHQDDEFPFMFSYDAVRIPLYMIWGGHRKKDLLRIYQAFWASTARGSRLVTSYGLSTNRIIQQENVLAYQAINSLVSCVITGKPATVLNNTFHKYDDYYSATIFLITRLAATEQLPSCIPGTVQAAGSSTCNAKSGLACALQDPIKRQSRLQNSATEVTDFLQPPTLSSRRPLNRFVRIAADASTEQLYLASMNGQIHAIIDGELAGTALLDIKKTISSKFFDQGNETGLTAFALHPRYSNSGKPEYRLIYTSHTEKPAANGEAPTLGEKLIKSPHHIDVITEWHLSGSGAGRSQEISKREVLRIPQPYAENNTVYLGFNPVEATRTKFPPLYVGIGDGGLDPTNLLADPYQSAQNLRSPLGKILRIQPHTRNKQPGYTIPKNNPFLKQKNVLPEIWAYGLHKPVDIIWGRGKNAKMLVLDQGKSGIQEINLGKAGANYGWSLRQGTFSVHPSNPEQIFPLPRNEKASGLTYPVIQYDKDEGTAIGNGLFYYGEKLSHLKNHFLFTDFDNGKLYAVANKHIRQGSVLTAERLKLMYNGLTRPTLQILNDDHRADLLLGSDKHGELFILTGRDGMIRKLQAERP